MSETEKTIGLVLLLIAAIVFLSWCKKSASQNGTSPCRVDTGGPAYLDTAADNSSSVAGVPEESDCTKKMPSMGTGSGTEGCH